MDTLFSRIVAFFSALEQPAHEAPARTVPHTPTRISIKVHGTGFATTVFSMSSDNSVVELLRLVEAHTLRSIRISHMRPLFHGRVLAPNGPLYAYGVKDGSVVLIDVVEPKLYRWSSDEFDASGSAAVPVAGHTLCGLNVKGAFDHGNDAWIQTWTIAYIATGVNRNGQSFPEVGFQASKLCGVPVFDPPYGYFFTKDVDRADDFATRCIIDGQSFKAVLQVRVDPRRCAELGNGLWAASSADDIRPCAVLIKGRARCTAAVTLTALNSLIPYAEVLTPTEYDIRSPAAEDNALGDLVVSRDTRVSPVGGALYTRHRAMWTPEPTETYRVAWPARLPQDLALEALSGAAGVKHRWNATNNDCVLVGPRGRVYAAATALVRTIDRWAPLDWTAGMETQLVELDADSPVYRHVSDRFFKTMNRNATRIVRIERVENRALYARYRDYLDAVKAKCCKTVRRRWTDGIPVERELFHGTQNTPPAVVYTGDHGFRRNYSGRCMWGRACYFAESAAYSGVKYVYRTDSAQKQVFLASVVTGLTEERIACSDRSIEQPGILEESTAECDHYDSVMGFTEEVFVYMVYNDFAAYPTYLITFEDVVSPVAATKDATPPAVTDASHA